MTEPMERLEVRDVRRHICCKHLPLAVYREVAAHLRQLDGIETGLVPQSSRQFDYADSQVGGLWIEYPTDASDRLRQHVERILAYYGDLYGAWLEVSG